MAVAGGIAGGKLTGSGGGLWLPATLVVLACTLVLIAAMGRGIGRYARRCRRPGTITRHPGRCDGPMSDRCARLSFGS